MPADDEEGSCRCGLPAACTLHSPGSVIIMITVSFILGLVILHSSLFIHCSLFIVLMFYISTYQHSPVVSNRPQELDTAEEFMTSLEA